MAELYDYAGLIEKFLSREITVQEFETIYFDKYLKNKIPLSEDAFQILDWMFFELDSYTDMPLRPDEDPHFHRTEAQLRENAAEILKQLRELQRSGHPLTRPI